MNFRKQRFSMGPEQGGPQYPPEMGLVGWLCAALLVAALLVCIWHNATEPRTITPAELGWGTVHPVRR